MKLFVYNITKIYYLQKKKMAKFYDIANLIDKNYQNNCYIQIDNDDFEERVRNYIQNNESLNTGDILFVGSTYETRQYYGFIIIDKRLEPNWYHSEQGIDLIFENDDLKHYLSTNNVKYQELFANLNNYFSELIGYKNYEQEIGLEYQDNNLW